MSNLDFSYLERTEIIGYSPLNKNSLTSKIVARYKPSQLPGDFVLIIEGKNQNNDSFVAVITSAVCATQYYIYQSNNKFVHGNNVFEVVKKAKINWQWNSNALNSIILLGYCLGNDSLHRDIKRINPGSIYYYCNNQLTITEDSFSTDIFNQKNFYPLNEALEIYNNVCDEYYLNQELNQEVCLSLSAGYDSRVLLASLLKRGIKPIVGTEGHPESTDVKTASAIAKDLKLEHRVLQLTENDYVTSADFIIENTSGEITLSAAWGAFLFLKRVKFPNKMLHLVGANGELFRTFYFDKGILCRIADLLPNLILKQFFAVYLKYKERQYKGIPVEAFSWNQQPLKSLEIANRCYQLSSIIKRSFSEQLDYFYTFYRVRNYIGKGLVLSSLINPTNSPFLDYRVVEAGAKLNRKYKLNNFFHHQILLDSYPQLINYPVNGMPIMNTIPETNFYWLQKKPKNKLAGKSLSERLMENTDLIDIFYNSPHLDNVVEQKYKSMIMENKAFTLFSFLITMHFVSEKISQSEC